jgi:hypothetical protein
VALLDKATTAKEATTVCSKECLVFDFETGDFILSLQYTVMSLTNRFFFVLFIWFLRLIDWYFVDCELKKSYIRIGLIAIVTCPVFG